MSCKDHNNEVAPEQPTKETSKQQVEEEEITEEEEGNETDELTHEINEDNKGDIIPASDIENPDNGTIDDNSKKNKDTNANPFIVPSDTISSETDSTSTDNFKPDNQDNTDTSENKDSSDSEDNRSGKGDTNATGNSEKTENNYNNDHTENNVDPEPTVKSELFMNLECESGLSAQGCACYGDFFIQAYANNPCFSIYNLKTKQKIGTFNIPSPAPNKKIHCNTICFGNQRVDPDDYFPLLYVCSGYKIAEKSRLLVYRITLSGNDCNIELVQNISLEGFGSWTEGIIDNSNNILWIRHSYGNQRFTVPDISEKNVTININDQLSSERFTRTTADNIEFGAWQGHLFNNNRICYVSGVPAKGQNLNFVSINTLTNELDYVIDLKRDAQLVNKQKSWDNTYEPEGVIYYEGKYMICYKDFIYAIDTEIE